MAVFGDPLATSRLLQSSILWLRFNGSVRVVESAFVHASPSYFPRELERGIVIQILSSRAAVPSWEGCSDLDGTLGRLFGGESDPHGLNGVVGADKDGDKLRVRIVLSRHLSRM